MNFVQIFIAFFVIICFIFIFPVVSSILAPFITIGQGQDSGGLFKFFLTMLPIILFGGGIYAIFMRGQ